MTAAPGHTHRPHLAVAFAVAALAIAAAIAAVHGTIDGPWWQFALLTLGAIGGGVLEVRIGPRSYISGPHDRLLLGVGRELLINVSRHADAQHVRVTATVDDGFVILEIHDDGRGMSDVERQRALANGHVGLASITDRVEALGGSVTIASPPRDGRGTTVTIRVPR